MKLLINQITRHLLLPGVNALNTAVVVHAFSSCKALLPALLLVAMSCLHSGCMDEDRLSSTYDPNCLLADETDMYMSINVPRTYASGGIANKENTVETLDVLVFAKGKADPDKYFVHAACKGTLTANANKFQVVMPVGDDFIVHVFANCHEAMVAKDFYNRRGKEMNAMLALLGGGMNVNDPDADALPMHGYVTGVSIDKSKVNTTLNVPVLRSVAAVQVMTKATDKDGILTPGSVTGDDGKKNFELRELYVYFYPDSGRIAADPAVYKPLAPGANDETRDVEKVSLPTNHRVSDTRWKDDTDPNRPKPYSIISATGVDRLGCLYLYENKPYSDTGFDQPDADNPAATSRLVVGGVYNNEKEADGSTPKVTYYRVDFADADNKLSEILRNHKYTFSIEKVSGSGYETPDDAATGVPINIYIQVIEWTNDIEHVDFSRQNFFYSQTKSIILGRNANSIKSIVVDSDVPVDEWKLSFKTETNGTTNTTVANTISNNRYKIEKAADGKSLIFTVLKAYKDMATGESRDETLVLKARDLEITYRITQEDKSPDDWGNGGDLNTDLGEDPNKPIDVGLGFVVAPGNLIATKQDDGALSYAFAEEQGYYSGITGGGDYFGWNTLSPFEFNINQPSWDDTRDPCRKVGNGEWRTPTKDQLDAMLNTGQKWGTYTMKDGTTTKNGQYFGPVTAQPSVEDQDKYVFLPAAGYRPNGASSGTSGVSSPGYYAVCWSRDAYNSTKSYYFSGDHGNSVTATYYSGAGLSIRCVRDK